MYYVGDENGTEKERNYIDCCGRYSLYFFESVLFYRLVSRGFGIYRCGGSIHKHVLYSFG